MRYFISDCHMMDGQPADEFNLKSKYLVSLIDRILEERTGDDVQELILLGDIIDFLEIHCEDELCDTAKYDEIALHQLEKRVFPAHPEVFDAIGRFLAEGNSVFYVWGNHDYPLRFGNVNEALAHKILGKTRDRTDYGKFTVADYYLSHKMLIYAEHGHRYDPLNVHRDAAPPVGSILIKEFIHKWGNHCYPGKLENFMDETPLEEVIEELGLDCGDGSVRPFVLIRAIRPRGNILDFIERLIRYGVLPSDVQKDMIDDLSDLMAKGGLDVRAKMIEWTGIRGLRQLQRIILRAGLADDTPRMLRSSARDIFKTIPNSIDLDYIPNICIMGHSHFIDARSWPDGEFVPRVENLHMNPEKQYYFNLGTWMNLCLVNNDGVPGMHYRECPYLRLRKEARGTVVADLRDAASANHSHIDLEKHRKNYIGYDTAFE